MTAEYPFSNSNVAELANLDTATIDRWSAARLVNPMTNGNGKGFHRRFSVVQAAAIMYGAILRETGAGFDWIAESVRFIAGQTPEELEEAFSEGRVLVFPLPAHLGQSQLMVPVTTGLTEKQVDYIRSL